jgi:hypothetical protein
MYMMLQRIFASYQATKPFRSPLSRVRHVYNLKCMTAAIKSELTVHELGNFRRSLLEFFDGQAHAAARACEPRDIIIVIDQRCTIDPTACPVSVYLSILLTRSMICRLV